MTRIEIGTGVGAKNFNPVDFAYQRETKDGQLPIINFLIGSQFNENMDGVLTASENDDGVGDPIEDVSNVVTGGKLEMTGAAAASEDIATSRMTHTTFSYMWPKTIIRSNLEILNDVVPEKTPNVEHDQRAQTIIEDLSNGDRVWVQLRAGNDGQGSGPLTPARLEFREQVGGAITLLAEVNLPAGEKVIDWELKFLDEGVSKLSYKFTNGEPTVLWRGDIKADIAECKVYHQLVTDQDVVSPFITVKFSFLWILYKSIFCGYDIAIEDKMKGCVCIWDTNGSETESDWQRVFSKDHPFKGDRVFENGLVRIRFKETPEMEVYGWQTFGTPAWVKIGSLIPKNSADTKATTLVNVIIRKFNDSTAVLDVNYGIVSHTYRLTKGMSYVRCYAKSKFFDFIPYQKERFALSADTPGTNLTKWNQEHSDDDNRGNPLGTYETAINPRIFTFNTNADTGLGHIDDVWYAVYNPVADDVVGWLGTFLKPNALEVEATSVTELKEIRFGFDKPALLAIGVLNSKPLTKTSGIPKPFFPGMEDDYVKWKANAAIFAFDQNPFIRKKR